jgi:hypothetical protein
MIGYDRSPELWLSDGADILLGGVLIEQHCYFRPLLVMNHRIVRNSVYDSAVLFSCIPAHLLPYYSVTLRNTFDRNGSCCSTGA